MLRSDCINQQNSNSKCNSLTKKSFLNKKKYFFLSKTIVKIFFVKN